MHCTLGGFLAILSIPDSIVVSYRQSVSRKFALCERHHNPL